MAADPLAETGDNIVSTSYIYGGTHNQFKVAFRRLGIEVRFANGDDPASVASLIDDKTKAIYAVPPSRAATRSSKTAVVGLVRRV